MSKLINFLVNTFFVVAIVDAANIFTNMKMKLFMLVMLLLLFTHKKGLNTKHLATFVITVLISILCYLFGRLYGYSCDNSFFLRYTMSFSLLLLLMWGKYFSVEKGMWIAANILAYGTIVAYLFCFIYPQFMPLIEAFANNDEGTPVIYISSRTFLGINFDGVFYTPLVFVVLPGSICIYRLLTDKTKKAKNLYMALLYSTALFCGGNRACLMCIVILWGGIGMYIVTKRHPVVKVLILPICIIGIIGLAATFLQEKGESSNEIKELHLLTYEKLLDSNPITYVTGMGAGSLVYTKGFNAKVPLMEWTYLELFRMYGVFSLYILYLFYGPVYKLWKTKKYYQYGIPISLGCLLYMISSYGNPYLINSTGFCLLIYLYSYLSNQRLKLDGKYR